MAFKKLVSVTVPFISALGISSMSFAGTGDYGVVQYLKNLKSPPAANNPVDQDLIEAVTLQDGTQVIEFNANSNNHSDGFKAGKYGLWQTITMDGDATGAKCADGSDYKFKIKRSARSSNMVVFLEGGGGCWSYESCSVSAGGFTPAGLLGGQEGSDNPDLILGVATQMSLATTALRPGYHPKFDNWTKVYMPYCTQDLGVGAITKTYQEKEGDGEKVMYHHGLKVQGAVLNWLKGNLERPGQLLLTGQSAGGFSSELLYHTYRTALEPQKSYMLNDAGPIMIAPQGENEDSYPSQHAHKAVTEAWEAHDFLTWMEEESAHTGSQFDYTNMGTISSFLTSRWADDRFMLVTARKDNTIAGFTYNSFFPEIRDEPSLDERDRLRDIYRLRDMDKKRKQLKDIDNYGFFAPGYRPIAGGHVLTIPLIESSTTNESDGKNVLDAIASLMNGSGRVMQSWEGNAGLSADKNGRYNDCINYFFSLGDQDKKGGDVYIHGADTSDSPNAGFQVLADILTGGTCLGEDPTEVSLNKLFDVTGISPMFGLAPIQDVLPNGTLFTATVNNAAAAAEAAAKKAAEEAAIKAAQVKAAAEAAAKKAAEEAARKVAQAKAAAEAAAKAAAEKARQAAEAARNVARRLCGRWCR